MEVPLREILPHNFPARPAQQPEPQPAQCDGESATSPGDGAAGDHDQEVSEEDLDDEDLESWREDLWLYRNRTQTMLRRYLRFSLETGRVPSILGREFFRSKVSSYTVATFEDRVIFVYDMERCLEKLDEFSRDVLTRVVLQEHCPLNLGGRFGWGWRTIYRRVDGALDALSVILLDRGLLRESPSE